MSAEDLEKYETEMELSLYKDVNVEELDKPDLRLPDSGPFPT